MLAWSGPIPVRGEWTFEVKWDGFRAIVSTRPHRVRSRRRAVGRHESSRVKQVLIASEMPSPGRSGRARKIPDSSCVSGL
jgi:hypothetical protein